MQEHHTEPVRDEQSAVEHRSITGWPGYRVGSDGSVWSCFTRGHNIVGTAWRQKKLVINHRKGGYLMVGLAGGGRKLTCAVHLLVAKAFLGPCPNSMECCHNEMPKTNNASSNLRWGTRASNIEDKIRDGATCPGEIHWRHKLTESDVLAIRELHTAGSSLAELGVRYGVRYTTIQKIVKRQAWKHVG